MHFKLKIVIAYSLLIITFTTIIGLVSANYMLNENEKTEKHEAEIVCERISDSLDKLIQPMEYAAYGLLSDVDLYSALQTLSATSIGEMGENYHAYDASLMIRSKLRSYAISRQFFRTSLLSEQGYFFTSRINSVSVISEAMVTKYNEISSTDKKKRFLITPVAIDSWAVSDPQEVFSLVVTIEGMKSKGYVEIQHKKEDLDAILNGQEMKAANIIALNDDSSIIYKSTDISMRLLEEFKSLEENKAIFIKIPESNQELTVVSVVSKYTGIKLEIGRAHV